MRSKPSKADQDLIKFLTDKGFSVSPYRLERWRAKGLLSRAIVERNGFGGSSVPAHPDDIREAAEILASETGQGRKTLNAVINLIINGYWVRQSTLQQAFTSYIVDQRLSDLIDDADSAGGGQAASEYEKRVDIGYRVADELMKRRSFRSVKLALLENARNHFPPLSKEEEVSATTEAVAMRIVDLISPGILSTEDAYKARLGDVIADGLPLQQLPSELMNVAATLTLDEAIMSVQQIDYEKHPSIAEIADYVLSQIADLRTEYSNSISQPLPTTVLINLFGEQLEDHPTPE